MERVLEMTAEDGPAIPDVQTRLAADIVHLVRMGMAGRPRDVQMYARRMTREYGPEHPQLTADLMNLLRRPLEASPLRAGSPGAATTAPTAVVPVDTESRLALLHTDQGVIAHTPVLPVEVSRTVERLIREHLTPDSLSQHGLAPTRSLLLTGPPGVGKTLLARWISERLGLPLLTLDLAAVMSSFLGRTGNNIRSVLDHARSRPCVLLLDELDAIAKRRDDAGEVGELKRLVTVLLQELDTWPAGSLLVAATNHPDLLDPAVWRRFEVVVSLGLPNPDQAEELVRRFVGPDVADGVVAALAAVARGVSPAELERDVLRARRASAVDDVTLETGLLEVLRDRASQLDRRTRVKVAASLVESKTLSQRRATEMLGVSRDTIRACLRDAEHA